MKKIKVIDKKLFFLTGLLFIIGLIMIYSSSNVAAYMRYEASPSHYFIRQLIFLITGYIGSLFIVKNSTKNHLLVSWILLLGISIVLILLLIYGSAVNNSISWIGYKGFGVQPSEFAKIIIIPWLASYYEINNKHFDNTWKMLVPLFVSSAITLFIFLQNDYGTALIFFLISIFIFFISKTSKRIKMNVFKFGLVCLFLVVTLFIATDGKILPKEKMARFDFLNPCDKFLTSGNQVCNGYIAINNGGLLGKGLGNSTQKYLYLPEAHTDFIFAIIIEEIGLIGGIGIIILFMLTIARIIAIGNKSKNDSGSIICFGVAFYIFLHIIINLGGLLGLLPLTGIPLSFMSYGGSFAWSMIFALAMVHRINYENNFKSKGNR